jgi:hypothetical protein
MQRFSGYGRPALPSIGTLNSDSLDIDAVMSLCSFMKEKFPYRTQFTKNSLFKVFFASWLEK